MPVLKPDYYIQSFESLDVNQLKEKGIRLLLCDIDNTLVSYDDLDSNAQVRAFIEKVEAAGIQVALMSNNFPVRTKPFGKDLGVEKIYSFSMKPLPFTFKKAMREYGLRADQTALMGDQLFTDILGGNLAGVYTILSHPIVEKDSLSTKMMRHLESMVFRHYEHQNIMKRGDFDA